MRSDRNKGRSGKGVYTPGSDYERDVELYRQIVGDSKDTGHYSHSRAAGEAPASKPQPRPSQRMEAGDGGTPHIRKRKKLSIEFRMPVTAAVRATVSLYVLPVKEERSINLIKKGTGSEG